MKPLLLQIEDLQRQGWKLDSGDMITMPPILYKDKQFRVVDYETNTVLEAKPVEEFNY